MKTMIEFIAHASIIGAVVCAALIFATMITELITAATKEDDGE